MAACPSCGAETPNAARFCPSCGASLAGQALAGPDERKLATVLFADLVGSTALADGEDPERTRALLEEFYAAMTDEIERTGGTVEGFAGDEVMAVFGAPASLEDHAERGLHAALSMQRRVSREFGGQLRLRIGVNTGDVVVGAVRDSGTYVTGDAVNVAARLEQAATPGEVLAGERTVASARGAFEFGKRQVIEAKGKPDGVACRPVLRPLTLARPRGVRGLHRAFVGRDAELELLLATYRRAAEQGEPHLVAVMGDSGVGKSRLMRELWARLQSGDAAPLLRVGRCLPYGDGITYWPLGEVLKAQLGIRDTDPPEAIAPRLADRAILGLALGLDSAEGLHPLEARERLHAEAVAFFGELVAERPAVVLLEDVHWAEEDMLDLIERVARDVRGPLLVLATARPELLERRQSLGGTRRNASTIWLEPLRPEATAQLVGELLHVELPKGLRSLVVERAEGNPFFVEELVGALVDEGVLELADGAWVAHELPSGFSIPDSVHAVLAARIDHLPPTEKAALQAASVVGRVFWRAPVVELLGSDEPDLSLLEERDFVRRRGTTSFDGDEEYVIKHALTREVAYGGIPKARRGRLHATFAAWLEASDPAKEEHAPLLAHHYAEAVRPDDADLVWAGESDELDRLRSSAVVWLRRASALAGSRYEIDEGVELLERAVPLAAVAEERADLLREVGMLNALRFDGDGFVAAMERSLDEAPDRTSASRTASVLALYASLQSGMWQRRPDVDVLEAWIARALELAEPGSTERARALVAHVHLGVDVDPAAAAQAAEALEIAEQLGEDDLLSYALEACANVSFEQSRFAEAMDWMDRRLALLPRLRADAATELLDGVVPAASAVCRFEEARELARRHVEQSQPLSPHHRLHGVSLCVEVEEHAGDWATVNGLRERACTAIEENRATPCVRHSRTLLVCALAALCAGDEAAAAELLAQEAALEMAGYDYATDAPRLRIALLRRDAGGARRLAGRPPTRTFVFGAIAQATRLDALVALGEREAAEALGAELALPGAYTEPFAQRALGWARRDDGLLERADARFREVGLDWYADQSESLLSGI